LKNYSFHSFLGAKVEVAESMEEISSNQQKISDGDKRSQNTRSRCKEKRSGSFDVQYNKELDLKPARMNRSISVDSGCSPNRKMLPLREEEWDFEPIFFYESESDEASSADVEMEKETPNEKKGPLKTKLDNTKRCFSFCSVSEIIKSFKGELLSASNITDTGRFKGAICNGKNIEDDRQSVFETQLSGTEQSIEPENMIRNFSMQSLVSMSKKALTLSLFQNQLKEEFCDEPLEEMHEIFRDGNFVMIDGLIVLAPQGKGR